MNNFISRYKELEFLNGEYKKNSSSLIVLYALLDKAKEVDWKKGSRREWYVLFSINGFTDKMLEIAKSRDDILLCN